LKRERIDGELGNRCYAEEADAVGGIDDGANAGQEIANLGRIENVHGLDAKGCQQTTVGP